MAKTLDKKRVFKTEQAFLNRFQDYLEDCAEKEKLPNISGFAYFAKIVRKTFYNQEKIYPRAFDLINSALEDETLNNTTQPPQIRTLVLTNRYRYSNKSEVVSENYNNNVNENYDLSKLTTEEIKQILAEELELDN